MTNKLGRRRELSGRAIHSGVMFVARIPRELHPKMKRAAQKQGLALGRWIVEQCAAAIGEKIEAATCAQRGKKSQS
jgi:predicted HicB family RNase H-like nuclease